MEKIKKLVTAPNFLWVFLIVKVIIYYCLIDVNVLTNPVLLLTAVAFWVLFSYLSEWKHKRRNVVFFVCYVFFSVIMFADTMYYNYYNQTVSVRQIYQVSNVAKVPESFVATLIPASFFIIWDIPAAVYYFRKRTEQLQQQVVTSHSKKRRWIVSLTGIFLVFLLAVNPLQSKAVTRINSVGFFSHHVKDIVDVACDALTDDFWSPQQVVEAVENATEETPASTELSRETRDLQGIAKGKNVLVIQLEAFQNFVINASYNGQELTPNLNRLLGEDSIYFDNYYSIIGKGNTADAEFATLNSIYPVIDGESYRLYTDNTYDGLPWQLKEEGYTTYGFHGNTASFWNRQAAYPYQGIDNFYSIERLDDTDIVGLGISDQSMFRQMVDVLKEEQGNFFSFCVSLTSHHPYELPEELQKLNIREEDQESKFANYLQAVHYTDAAIGELIAELKEAGIYENTVIAFYGDHHGLNCTMDDNDIYVGNYLGKEYGFEEMLKVPCIIHIPGSGVTKTVSTLGCQVDFLPTMAYLMDLKIDSHPYIMGENLLTAEHGFAAFTAYLFEGSFAYDDIMFQISREGIFEGSSAWNRQTGAAVDISAYEQQYEKAVELKEASRQVLEQDLIAEYVTHQVEPAEILEEEQKQDKEREEEKEVTNHTEE